MGGCIATRADDAGRNEETGMSGNYWIQCTDKPATFQQWLSINSAEIAWVLCVAFICVTVVIVACIGVTSECLSREDDSENGAE